MITERENMLLVLQGKQPHWIPDYNTATVTVRPSALGKRKDASSGHLIDIYGVHFINAPDGIMVVEDDKTGHVFTDITKWQEHMPQIDLDNIDWETEAQKCKAQAEKAQDENHTGEKLSCLFGAGALWEQMHYMMGFENAFVALASEPEECYRFLQSLADFQVDAFHRLCKHYKPDMALLMDHFAVANGLMMSPETYREIIKPAQAKIIKAFRDEGVVSQLHCDGKIDAVVPDLAEIGLEVIQPFQIFNDIEAAKEKYGIICVGGWDAFGPGNAHDASEEEVRRSVRVAMDTYGPTHRYVFWNSGITGRDIDKSKWMKDEAYSYGRSFYSH